MIHKIRIGCLAILAIFLVYSAYFALTNPMNPTYEDCGEVVSKSSDKLQLNMELKLSYT